MSQSPRLPAPGRLLDRSRPQAHFRAVADLSGVAALRGLTFSHRTLGLGALARVALVCDALAALNTALADGRRSSRSCCPPATARRSTGARGCLGDETSGVRRAGGAQLDAGGSAIVDERTAAARRRRGRHLSACAAGLESLALGEAEILGQARTALEQATSAGPFLRGVVVAALQDRRHGAR